MKHSYATTPSYERSYVYKCETAEENSHLNITPLKNVAPIVYNIEKRNQPKKSEIFLTSKTPVKQQTKNNCGIFNGLQRPMYSNLYFTF